MLNNEFFIEDIRAALEAHEPEAEASEASSRNASVAVVLSEAPMGELAMLFMQRAEHPQDPWSGQMSFPGGGVEAHDDTLMHGAMRETLEEVGLPLEESQCIGRLHDQYRGRLALHELAVSPFVFYCPDPPALVHNEEVADTVWVPLSYMADLVNTVPYQFNCDPERRDFPSFHYQEFTIWGLTYRMIRDFFALLDVELPKDPELERDED